MRSISCLLVWLGFGLLVLFYYWCCCLSLSLSLNLSFLCCFVFEIWKTDKGNVCELSVVKGKGLRMMVTVDLILNLVGSHSYHLTLVYCCDFPHLCKYKRRGSLYFYSIKHSTYFIFLHKISTNNILFFYIKVLLIKIKRSIYNETFNLIIIISVNICLFFFKKQKWHTYSHKQRHFFDTRRIRERSQRTRIFVKIIQTKQSTDTQTSQRVRPLIMSNFFLFFWKSQKKLIY